MSVWGEVDANNLETRVRSEMQTTFHPAPSVLVVGDLDLDHMRELGRPGETTRNLYKLCDARQWLLNDSGNFWLYRYEPLVWVSEIDLINMSSPVDIPDWITGIYNIWVPQQICSSYQGIADFIGDTLEDIGVPTFPIPPIDINPFN